MRYSALWTFLAFAIASAHRKNLIIDTDLFSDCDDAAALLLATTLPNANLIAVNVNYPSSYSALAASAILGYYGHRNTPVGISRPLTNESFFDSWAFGLGEYASKVAYHWRDDAALPWGGADKAWGPVDLYRKVLSEARDGSVTIVSLGFFDNLSGLLNSTADKHSKLDGRQLIEKKVDSLVVMGGGYPSGYEFNFWGGDPALTAHVVNTWKGRIVFSGTELGGNITSGGPLMRYGPEQDPVRAAYRWYTYGKPRESWDPLTVLYAVQGPGTLFKEEGKGGYNFVEKNGSNHWIWDKKVNNQRWLSLKVSNETVGSKLDELYLRGVRRVA